MFDNISDSSNSDHSNKSILSYFTKKEQKIEAAEKKSEVNSIELEHKEQSENNLSNMANYDQESFKKNSADKSESYFLDCDTVWCVYLLLCNNSLLPFFIQ